jgi:hypothetical protein
MGSRVAAHRGEIGLMDLIKLVHVDWHTCTILAMYKKKCFHH